MGIPFKVQSPSEHRRPIMKNMTCDLGFGLRGIKGSEYSDGVNASAWFESFG